jgi:hypothetical protein
MGRPGIRGDLVFPPTRIAARLGFHFEQYEIAKAALGQAPRGAQAGHPPAHNHDREFFDARGFRECCMVANAVPGGERVVDEAASDAPFAFRGEPDQGRAQELASCRHFRKLVDRPDSRLLDRKCVQVHIESKRHLVSRRCLALSNKYDVRIQDHVGGFDKPRKVQIVGDDFFASQLGYDFTPHGAIHDVNVW